ncbi:MAG: guanylate kinase [Candidatus Acidiferrales bacterium]
MTQEKPVPLVLIVSGPSGSGKSTLVSKLRELPGTLFSVSCTTRPPRAQESPGKWYDFISEQDFDRMARRGEFLESAQVFGHHRYGTPRKWLDKAREERLDLVLEIDVQGAAQVKQKIPEAVAIFILPPSRQELERRLRARGQDSDDSIAKRLDRARKEVERYREYDYLIVNDDLDRADNTILAIALAERAARRVMTERAQEILDSFGG